MQAHSSPILRVHRPFDLGAIDAVGFDLDHTLAIYDDAAVNEIAASAARGLLVERLSYPRAILNPADSMETPPAARTLAADLTHGAVIKLGADRRVLHARHARRWLEPGEIETRFAGTLDDRAGGIYSVYSPFELPVLWLLEELEAAAPLTGARGSRCEDIRRMLDAAHTGGLLKNRLREDLPRFVAASPGLAVALGRWVSAGKRLFVVTNSEPDFAAGVLERVIGTSWPDLFDVVVASARKPGFFEAPAASQGAGEMRRTGHALVMEGGSAATLEEMLGLRSGRVLFVGDNVRSDIRSARAHGWHTAHVAPELAFDDRTVADEWGAPLTHGGRPTWLAQLLREADIACDGVMRLLAIDPETPLVRREDNPAGAETP
ncbi:MAG: HAD hydrolase-like protein [Candidatus Krumholzibacteria bacterium]|nr:HAD hydrolase-like protein [Candidatus Krumholzibacteria bacterium]MDH4337844.1 HAD hydrolase-like protein [Candidatus Krumholzibacteria bacterium]MDH5270611.1 HAD hydrolase-like protein [Candidatus Krumholzibacteria bacterium]